MKPIHIIILVLPLVFALGAAPRSCGKPKKSGGPMAPRPQAQPQPGKGAGKGEPNKNAGRDDLQHDDNLQAAPDGTGGNGKGLDAGQEERADRVTDQINGLSQGTPAEDSRLGQPIGQPQAIPRVPTSSRINPGLRSLSETGTQQRGTQPTDDKKSPTRRGVRDSKTHRQPR